MMKPCGSICIDSPGVKAEERPTPLEIVVPYTEWPLGLAAIERAAVLSAKLPAAIRLIAVHAVPYPMQFGCVAAVHANLVERLVDLASRSSLTVQPQVVLARGRREGFRNAMPAKSLVLLASRRRTWRTAEERLANAFTEEGHEVSLFYVE